MLTLNQDIELFNQFAVKHKGLNTYRFGYELVVGELGSAVYPLMEVLPQGTTYTKGMVSRKYLIAISDLVNKDNSNENKVLSDCEQICLDLPNYLRKVATSKLLGAFTVNEDISLTDFTDRGKDTVTGLEFEITISSHIGANSCNLPIEAGNILSDNYIYVGGTVSTSVFTVEIKDENGNVIQTFNTSGEYVVTILSGIKDTITGNVTTITDNII